MPGDIVRDRVNELYRGEIFESDTQRSCRDRIHWMCAQVSGNDVLDVGCSQGITALLLGREGHHVVGVDLDPEAIRYAQGELDKESDHVKRNVEFRCVGGDALPFADESFDTVLMGEVLEHLTRPERMLAEARRLLRPQGRAVITTPFGVHPHAGHVRTFFLSNFLSMVGQFFGINNLRVTDGYINCVGVKSSPDSQEAEWSLEKLLLMSEAGYLAKEQRHWQQRERLSQQRHALREDLTRVRDDLATTKKAAREAQARLHRLERRAREDAGTCRNALQGIQDLLTAAQDQPEVIDLTRRTKQFLAQLSSDSAETATNPTPLLLDTSRSFARRLHQLNTDYHSRLTELQQQLAENGHNLKRAEERIQELTRDHAGTVKELTDQITEMRILLQRPLEELHKMQTQHDTAMAALQTQLSAQQSAFEVETSRAAVEHNSAIAALQTQLSAQRTAFEAETSRAAVEHNLAIAALQAQLASQQAGFAEEISRLSTEKQQAAEKRAAGQARLIELHRQRDRLVAEARATRKKLNSLSAACNSVRRELQREKGRTESLRVKCRVWSDHLEDLQHSVRWRIGDMIVGLADSPASLFTLPIRLTKLFLEGRRRRRVREQTAPSTQGNGFSAGAAVSGTVQATGGKHAGHAVKPAGRAPAPVVIDHGNAGVTPRREINVACILDEFSLTCFRPEARLYELTPCDWRAQMEAARPAFLFVESAWRGRDESWRHLVSCTRREGSGPLLEIVEYCRSRNIPTVFWNKEDPANFEHFIDTAAWFDVVFTTDSDCLDAYKKATGHDRCYALPFAAQERIHHPMGRRGGELGRLAFAGTWYSQKHDGRRVDAEMILRPALEYGLHIYDRMHTFTGPGWQNYQWPEEYHAAIRGGLSYDEMLDAYRKYHLFLNVNSVRNSPTMCARRVFEILACGTNVISAYTPAIENLLGADYVFQSRTCEDTRAHLEMLLSNEALRNRASVRGIRRVMASHTYVHRFARILESIGRTEEVGDPKLACLLTVANRDDLAAARRFVDRQSYAGMQPVWMIADASLQLDCPGSAQVFGSETEWAASVTRVLSGMGADLVLRWTPQTPPGGEWVEDLARAFSYFDGDGAGKPMDTPADKLLFRRAETLNLSTSVLRASAVERLGLAALASDAAFSDAIRRHKPTLLATDTVGLQPG